MRGPALLWSAIVPADLGTVVPAQWGRRPLTRRGEGWSRLGAAILADAWACLDYPGESALYRAAVAFFLDPPLAEVPVSCQFACTLADVDLEALRRRVRTRLEARASAWRERRP